MKQPTPLLGGLLSLFLCFTPASSRAADPLNQWMSGAFPKDSSFAGSFRANGPFGADAIIGGNSFLAAGRVGPSCDCPDIIYTSTDGLHWTSTPGTDYNGVSAITSGDSGLWAANAQGIASRVKRPGGSGPSGPPDASTYMYHDITFGDGLYVAVGEAWLNSASTKRTNIIYSTTGSSWSYALWNTVTASAPKPRTVAVAFGNGYFLGIGRTNSLLSTVGHSDLRVATTASLSGIVPWPALTYNPGSAGVVPFPPFNDVAYGNGVIVLVGTNILVISNPNFGVSLTVTDLPVIPPTTNVIQKVFFLNGRFLAAAGAEILSSPDGYTWKNHGALATVTGPKYISDVAYANGRYVAISGTNFFVAPFTQLAAETPGGRLRISGSTGYVHQVSASTTLASNSWQSVTNLLLTNSPQTWIDPQGTNLPARFYRTSVVP